MMLAVSRLPRNHRRMRGFCRKNRLANAASMASTARLRLRMPTPLLKACWLSSRASASRAFTTWAKASSLGGRWLPVRMSCQEKKTRQSREQRKSRVDFMQKERRG